MTIHPVLIEYEGRLRELQAGLARGRMQNAAAAAVLTITAALSLTLGLYAIRQRIPLWWPLPPILMAAASAWRYQRHRTAQSRMWRVQRFYGRAAQRVRGMWAGEGTTGEELAGADHMYARDLGVFGEGSLFELLCIARTAIGRRALANYLLEAPLLDETLARQEAVRELRERTDLREKVACLGEFEFSESKRETFVEWLDSPLAPFDKPWRVAAAITSTAVAGIVLAGMLGLLPWMRAAFWLWPLLLFHLAAGLMYRRRVKRMAGSFGSVSIEIRLLREGLQLLEPRRFQSAKLAQLVERVHNASKPVRNLERLLYALSENHRLEGGGYSNGL
jgi:hypothetical protein